VPGGICSRRGRQLHRRWRRSAGRRRAQRPRRARSPGAVRAGPGVRRWPAAGRSQSARSGDSVLEAGVVAVGPGPQHGFLNEVLGAAAITAGERGGHSQQGRPVLGVQVMEDRVGVLRGVRAMVLFPFPELPTAETPSEAQSATAQSGQSSVVTTDFGLGYWVADPLRRKSRCRSRPPCRHDCSAVRREGWRYRSGPSKRIFSRSTASASATGKGGSFSFTEPRIMWTQTPRHRWKWSLTRARFFCASTTIGTIATRSLRLVT
jgi:hypothetical protein